MKIVAMWKSADSGVAFNVDTEELYSRPIVWEDFVRWLDDRKITLKMFADYTMCPDPSIFYDVEIDTSNEDLMFEFKHRWG